MQFYRGVGNMEKVLDTLILLRFFFIKYLKMLEFDIFYLGVFV